MWDSLDGRVDLPLLGLTGYVADQGLRAQAHRILK
jgi:hypothetical protein